MASVRLKLLGRPAVVVDGAERPWPAARPDAVLTVLAVRRGWVRREELAFLFQPDRRDAEARAWVRQALHRAARRPWATALEHDGDAVRWAVASDLSDVHDALAAGDAAAAVAATGGPLLQDWHPGDSATGAWLEAERTHLRDAWTAAVGPWVRAREDAGDAAAVLVAYRAWQHLDPDDEEALHGELRALHAAHGPAAARRRFKAYVAGVRDGLDAAPEEAPPRAAAAARAALPVPMRHTVGREAMRASAAERLTGGATRWLTLHGRAGMGASLLGLEVAWTAGDAFAGGAVPVAASGLMGPDELEAALADALGMPGSPAEAIERRLRAAPTLLWLDAGDVGSADGAWLAGWLDRAPGSAWLVAARRPLGGAGEQAWELGGLDPAAARALFVERALATDPAFAVAPGDEDALDALIAHVGGWPLAIEVAAGWVTTVPLRALAERLDPLLAAPGADGRASPISVALGAAHERLDPEDAAVLAALTAFAGPIGADAAEAVAGPRALPALARLRRVGLVERGVDGRHRVHPLVAADAAGRVPHVADAARLAHARWTAAAARGWSARLRGGDPVVAARAVDGAIADLERAAAVLLDRAVSEAGDRTALLADAVAVAEARFLHATVRGRDRDAAPPLADLDARLRAARAPAALRARVVGWWAYADQDAPPDVRAARLAEALELAGDAPEAQAAAAFAHVALGTLAHHGGRQEEARKAVEVAIARAERAEDASVLAWALHLRGAIGFGLGEGAATLEAWFGRALGVARAARDVEASALALTNLGELALAEGDLPAAEARYLAALEALEALANPRLTAVVTGRLGRLSLRRGDVASAEVRLRAAWDALEALADDRGSAAVAQDLARAARLHGDLAAARGALRTAVARALDGRELAVALEAAVDLADLDDDPDRAARWLTTLHGWSVGVHEEVAAYARARLVARGRPVAASRAPLDDDARHRLRAFAAG